MVTGSFAGPQDNVRGFVGAIATHLMLLVGHYTKQESSAAPHRPAIIPAMLCLIGWMGRQDECVSRSIAQELQNATIQLLADDNLNKQLQRAAVGDPSWAHSTAAAVLGGAFLMNCPHTLRALMDGTRDTRRAAEAWMALAARLLCAGLEERGEGEEASNELQPERVLGIIWEYGLPSRVLLVSMQSGR